MLKKRNLLFTAESKEDEPLPSKGQIEEKIKANAKALSSNDELLGKLGSLAPVLSMLLSLVWHLGNGYGKLHEALMSVDKHARDGLVGLTMCFFGGTFLALTSAWEALQMSGWDETVTFTKQLFEQVGKLQRADSIDNKIDADNDGIADVKQLQNGQKFVELAKVRMMADGWSKLKELSG